MFILRRRWDEVQANFSFVCYALRYTFISWQAVNHGTMTEIRHVVIIRGGHVTRRYERVSVKLNHNMHDFEDTVEVDVE